MRIVLELGPYEENRPGKRGTILHRSLGTQYRHAWLLGVSVFKQKSSYLLT